MFGRCQKGLEEPQDHLYNPDLEAVEIPQPHDSKGKRQAKKTEKATTYSGMKQHSEGAQPSPAAAMRVTAFTHSCYIFFSVFFK